MRFYTRQHRFYCGVDLHARSMYVCVLDHEGNVLVSKDIPTAPEPFVRPIAPYREDLAVAAECMFTWYWLAEHFAEAAVRKSIEADLSLIDHYDRELPRLERYIESLAQRHDPLALAIVRTIHGMGTARARAWRSSPRSSPALCISCSSGARRSTPSVSSPIDHDSVPVSAQPQRSNWSHQGARPALSRSTDVRMPLEHAATLAATARQPFALMGREPRHRIVPRLRSCFSCSPAPTPSAARTGRNPAIASQTH